MKYILTVLFLTGCIFSTEDEYDRSDLENRIQWVEDILNSQCRDSIPRIDNSKITLVNETGVILDQVYSPGQVVWFTENQEVKQLTLLYRRVGDCHTIQGQMPGNFYNRSKTIIQFDDKNIQHWKDVRNAEIFRFIIYLKRKG